MKWLRGTYAVWPSENDFIHNSKHALTILPLFEPFTASLFPDDLSLAVGTSSPRRMS